MNKTRALKILTTYIREQFPITCGCCGRTFFSLRQLVENTTPVGTPICYDAEREDFKFCRPLGTVSFVNCSCGSTVSLTSDKMNRITYWRLFRWLQKEAQRTSEPINSILDQLRKTLNAEAGTRRRSVYECAELLKQRQRYIKPTHFHRSKSSTRRSFSAVGQTTT